MTQRIRKILKELYFEGLRDQENAESWEGHIDQAARDIKDVIVRASLIEFKSGNEDFEMGLRAGMCEYRDNLLKELGQEEE